MKVKDLIECLQHCNPDARVFTAYDGNIVVNKPASVEEIGSYDQIGKCWWTVSVGDVVILGKE